MFDHNDYAACGYDDGGMGDLSDYTDTLFDVARGFLTPGGSVPNFQPVVDAALDGASSGGGLTGGLSSALGPSSAKVTAPSGLKLRAEPRETSAHKATLPTGTSVTVLETGFPPTAAAPKGWTKVRTAAGTEGYMSTEWLSISSPTSATSGNTSAMLSNLLGSSSSSSGSATKPAAKPSSSLFENKALLIGGGVIAAAVAAALLFGGKKKKA